MNAFKIILLTLFVPASLLLTNCSVPPNAVLKLKPETENTEWYKGKEIATLDNDSVVIRISFDRSLNKEYLFDVDITNYSQKTVLVEPEKFSYKIISGKIKGGDAIILSAKNPEKVIIELQKSQSIHQSNLETQAMLYSLGYFLQFAGQTKALVTGDVELSKQIDIEGRKMKEEELINDIQNQRINQSLDNSSYLWEILALRKTTLYPYHSISGKVFFPISGLAEILEFSFPIDEQVLKILFNQDVIPLYKKYVDPKTYY